VQKPFQKWSHVNSRRWKDNLTVAEVRIICLKMNLMEVVCEDRWCKELSQDHVQQQVLEFVVLTFKLHYQRVCYSQPQLFHPHQFTQHSQSDNYGLVHASGQKAQVFTAQETFYMAVSIAHCSHCMNRQMLV
jgi:hypothetical protein